MARRRSARHARPTGRGALAAAYAALEVDVWRLRSTTYTDHLELIRLAALVDGLVAQVTRLTTELAEMRRELSAARTAPAQPDPYAEMLAAQVSELRATVATQQAMLADLTRRMIDLLEHLEATTTVASAAATPRAPEPTRPEPTVPTAYPEPTAPGDPASRPGQLAASDEALDDETVLRLRLIRESFGR
jgi:cell division septation protein DedD